MRAAAPPLDAPGSDRAAQSLARTAASFLSHTSPRVLLLQLGVAAPLRLFAARPSVADAIIAVAVIVYWPVQEWLLHRVVLHARPRTIAGLRLDTAPARAHRRHHRDPRDLRYTVLPGRSMLLMVPLHLLFWWLVTPTWSTALTGVCCFGAAALVYEWIHFLCHAPYRARSGYLRRVRAHHALHHYKNEQYWHSFTLPALDRLFGTGPRPSEVPLSAHCRDLGIADE